MRFIKALSIVTVLVVSPACYLLESVGGSCIQEQLVVSWPVTITRGTSVTSQLLTTTLTPSNLDQTQFNVLRGLLTNRGAGQTGTYAVTWTVPAFNINGGYIALVHDAPLSPGATRQITSAFDGGGWGAQPVAAAMPAAIAVRADNLSAATASGSISVLDAVPLRLHIDATANSAAGETMRIAGDAGFAYQSVNAICD